MPCWAFVLGSDFLPPTKGTLEQAESDAPRATPDTSTTATLRTRALLRLIKRSLRKLRDVGALARTRARRHETPTARLYNTVKRGDDKAKSQQTITGDPTLCDKAASFDPNRPKSRDA